MSPITIHINDDPGDVFGYMPYVWCVTNYKADPYDGIGVLVLKDMNGKYQTKNLGHCSCYGPLGLGSTQFEEFDSWDHVLANNGQPGDFDEELWTRVFEVVNEKELPK